MSDPSNPAPPQLGVSRKDAGGSSDGNSNRLPLNLMRRRNNESSPPAPRHFDVQGAESGSSNAGNNSDNSALVSIGNASFGFNFDSEEGNSTPPTSEQNDTSDSDGNNNGGENNSARKTNTGISSDAHRGRPVAWQTPATAVMSGQDEAEDEEEPQSVDRKTDNNGSMPSGDSQAVPQGNTLSPTYRMSHLLQMMSSTSSVTSSSASNNQGLATYAQADIGAALAAHSEAAADIVANLQSIANSCVALTAQSNAQGGEQQGPDGYGGTDQEGSLHQYLHRFQTSSDDRKGSGSSTVRKRKSIGGRNDNDSIGGYNTDDDEDQDRDDCGDFLMGGCGGSSVASGNCDASASGKSRKKGKMDNKKREERNAREKERSFRISKQINELRCLLSSGGVIVPKGTKSSVLTEAAKYIRMLQQHQYRSEIDRHQLVQQMQLIGSGAHGPQAASAIRQVAAQNGVWSLGNFGGMPPKSAMSPYRQTSETPEETSSSQREDGLLPAKIDTTDYRFVFNSCGVAMAIASMGGAFIDCNQLFCLLSNYSKQEICSLTIFNLTARQDLQHAFDQISQLISPPMDARIEDQPRQITVRGAVKNRNDVGLCVSVVKGDDGIAKCFCVTLIKNPSSPFDTSKPIPLSFDAVQQPQPVMAMQPKKSDMNPAPAFTTG